MEAMRPLVCGPGHSTAPLPLGFSRGASSLASRSKIRTVGKVANVQFEGRARSAVVASLEQSFPAGKRAVGTTERTGTESWPPTQREAAKPRAGEMLRRWASGPLQYYASWLIPASSFLAVYSTAMCHWLSSIVLDIPGALARMVPFVSRAMWLNTFCTVLAYSGAIFGFIILPILDGAMGEDKRVAEEAVARETSYKLPVQLMVPINLALLTCACSQASVLLTSPALFIGVIMSIGVSGGLALTAAHNLIHSRNWWDSILADVLLCTTFYMHWSYGHMAHHLQVGTPEDPATARFGESYYSFVPRSVTGAFKDALRMERHRLEGHGHSLLSPQNRMFKWFLAPSALLACTFWFFGVAGCLMLLGYAACSILLLEGVNYIEHYGLVRAKLPNGRYAPVGPQHSWDADWRLTNAVMYKLQRHAHHHMNASKPYQALKSIPEAPVLPASYPSMMILALWPPQWFRVMNPLVEKARTRRSVGSASRGSGQRTNKIDGE